MSGSDLSGTVPAYVWTFLKLSEYKGLKMCGSVPDTLCNNLLSQKRWRFPKLGLKVTCLPR